jgi:hypothetical protein
MAEKRSAWPSSGIVLPLHVRSDICRFTRPLARKVASHGSYTSDRYAM